MSLNVYLEPTTIFRFHSGKKALCIPDIRKNEISKMGKNCQFWNFLKGIIGQSGQEWVILGAEIWQFLHGSKTSCQLSGK